MLAGYLQSWTLYLGAPTTPTRKLSTESQYRIRDPDRDLELDKSQAMDFHGKIISTGQRTTTLLYAGFCPSLCWVGNDTLNRLVQLVTHR